jgi:type II secretory ATPase GspE/PulE/Tfp pilus assembly ATPase PilB-like protein
VKAIDLSRVLISPDVLDLMPRRMARRLGALPVARREETLYVAVRDPEDDRAQERLEAVTGLDVVPVPVTHPDRIDAVLERYYAEPVKDEVGGEAAALLQTLLNRALQTRVSDIHVEPGPEGGEVRMRLDGRLQQEREIQKETIQELISYVKVRARLNIAEKRIPLDGQIAVPVVGGEVNLRVATMPTVHGERLTIRVLSGSYLEDLSTLESLGMSEEHRREVDTTIRRSHGLLVLSGPTGSGKTTTMYVLLRLLQEGAERHIISVEDPVEMIMPGVTQVPVDSEGNRMRFLIGETRDQETAEVAGNAALTGHLVLTTIHANSAADVPARFLELGMKPFMAASALRLAFAQRLVRRPCPQCLRWEAPTDEERRTFGWDEAEQVQVPRSSGCPLCNQQGYAGRIGLFELAAVDEQIRQLIMQQAPSGTVAQQAFEREGRPTLLQDGAAKIRRGMTTASEVLDAASSV